MVKIRYCDKCGKQISPWDNEFGQVLSVMVTIDSGNSRDMWDGNMEFCSPTCAIEFLKSQKKIEDYWIDVWKKGKILGVAPHKPNKERTHG